jgi:putative GTP pyrophosphokinase
MTEEGNAPSFDFEAHRRQAVDAYAKVRSKNQEFGFAVRNILREATERKELKVHSIEARAKSLDSFGGKAIRPSEEDPDLPKYRDPLREITDLAAVRVITFFPRTIKEVDARIREQFRVLEQVDHTQLLEREERFGYKSVHYLIELKGDRTRLPEYERFAGIVAEIQVRTVLQHAWAEIEHDIQYKSAITIPTEIRRRFVALAGMLELADREFQGIQDSDSEFREEARKSVQKGEFEAVEITPDAVRAYLDKKFGPDYRMSPFSYEYSARLLRKLGFINFRQVDECISMYDDDKVSRVVYGARQGQITRFECLLLAGMGEEFLRRHFWKDDWYRTAVQTRLQKLRDAGVDVGSYRPASTAPSEGQAESGTTVGVRTD